MDTRRRTRTSILGCLLVTGTSLLFGSGCAASFPRPFSAAEATHAGTGAALASYLDQSEATPALCDATSDSPHMPALHPDDFTDLTRALVDGHIDLLLFRRCADKLLTTQPAPAPEYFLDAMGKAYRKMLHDSDLERDPRLAARLDVMHQIYLLRPQGIAPHPELMKDLILDLKQAREKKRLGPIALRYGDDLLATLDLEQGNWEGRPVDAATLDALQAKGDETMLRRFAARLPDEMRRTEARRRIVRMHIAASPWPEVREYAADVEARVIATGRNAVDPRQIKPVRGFLDASTSPLSRVVASQNVWQQLVTFQGYRGGGQAAYEMDMRRALRIQLSGISQPAPLCQAPDALDVSPCVLPTDVSLEGAVASLDRDGGLRFVDHISSGAAVAMVREKPDLVVPVDVAGQRLFDFTLPLYFKRPDNVVFNGPTGERGPDVRVTVERRDGRRLILGAGSGGTPLQTIVEMPDAGSFVLASGGGQGAAGSSGMDGMDGSDGTDGMSASCGGGSGGDGSSGGNGSDGGSGSDGGNGGDGGNVDVRVTCSDGDCTGLVREVQHMVRSLGGAGGSGGSGGRGGRGGRGGSGGSSASCTDSDGNSYTVSGGSSGSDGMSGSDGSSGADGAPGKPGRVTVAVVPAAR